VNILLLSRDTGAILPFLTGSNRAKGPLDGYRIAYIDDAQQSFAGAAFVEAERAALEELAGHIVPGQVRLRHERIPLRATTLQGRAGVCRMSSARFPEGVR